MVEALLLLLMMMMMMRMMMMMMVMIMMTMKMIAEGFRLMLLQGAEKRQFPISLLLSSASDFRQLVYHCKKIPT